MPRKMCSPTTPSLDCTLSRLTAKQKHHLHHTAQSPERQYYHTPVEWVSITGSSVRAADKSLHDLGHSAFIHSVGKNLAALCKKDAGRSCGGAVGD